MRHILFCLAVLWLGACALTPKDPPYGQLSVKGTQLVGADGKPVQLIGMSLFWSQWMGQYFTKDTVDALACQWGANIVRAVMGVEKDGYLSNKQRELAKVRAVVEAAIERGIYVIIDWHDHEAHNHKQDAIDFFKQMATDYGKYPHVLYETFNEPLQVEWNAVLKPYHTDVLKAIRAIDPDNVALLGTPSYSGASGIVDAKNSPLCGQTNVMYVQHFYSGTHRAIAQITYSKAAAKIPVFISEYGISEADGGSNGQIYTEEAKKWYTLLDENKASYVAWSICDKNEASSALKPGTQPNQVGNDAQLSDAGVFLKSMIKSKKLYTCDDYVPSPNPRPKPAPGPAPVPVPGPAPAPDTSSCSNGLCLQVKITSTWPFGAQLELVFTNNGASTVCSAHVKLQKDRSTSFSSLWGLDNTGIDQYKTPDYVNIAGGQTHIAGAIVIGSKIPTFRIVSTNTKC